MLLFRMPRIIPYPSGFQITQPSDNKGFFVYRNAVGNGTATLDSVKVRWNYGADNADVTSNMDLKVFGIEMVYVPQGEFWCGRRIYYAG